MLKKAEDEHLRHKEMLLLKPEIFNNANYEIIHIIFI